MWFTKRRKQKKHNKRKEHINIADKDRVKGLEGTTWF